MKELVRILDTVDASPDHVFLQETRDGALFGFPGAHLAQGIRRARAWLAGAGVAKGDRVALVAGNSAVWALTDLAIIAEGAIAVPLYARSLPAELGRMIADADPALVLVETDEMREALAAEGVRAPIHLLQVLEQGEGVPGRPVERQGSDPVAILYTSGTSGEPKGVILDGDNLDFMLERANGRLDQLMGREAGPDRVYHYLPFCFAGSWLMLLLCLRRRAILTLNTDLASIVDDLGLVKPHYFQNVPVLLERMRDGVTQAMERRLVTRGVFGAAMRAHAARTSGRSPGFGERIAAVIARTVLFPTVRRRLGPRLRALICGSAPLSRDTQLFFDLLDIPVLQVYGLTETTAILTMDEPDHVVPGRVGPAVEDVELKLGDLGEILARGPNVFRGYWNRPEATQASFVDGWLRTGDQGEVDENGNWRVLGRVKSLLVPASGHNVAPEPLEQAIAARLPEALQVIVVGDSRPYLAVVLTGAVDPEDVPTALEELNESLPHYQRIRGSMIIRQPFTVESGLVTANGKLRRAAIEKAIREQIDEMYERHAVPV